jgi:predicted permease
MRGLVGSNILRRLSVLLAKTLHPYRMRFMATYFIPVLFAVIQVVTMSFFGYILRAKNRLGTDFFNQLNEFLVKIALPLYYFTRVSRTDIADVASSLFFPLAALVIIGATAGLSWAYFTALRYEGALKRTAVGLAVFGNAGFFPIFFAELFPSTIPAFMDRFGVTAPLLYIGTYMLVGSPVLWGGGNYLYAGAGEPIRLRKLLTPPVFGILGGLFVTVSGLQPYLLNARLPFYYMYSAMNSMGSVVPPLMLLCLGATIANLKGAKSADRKSLLRVSVHVSAMRLLILPALFFGGYFLILRPLRLSPAHSWVIFLQMVIPPATSLSILAARGKSNEEYVGFTLLVSYVLYIAVLPLFLMLFISLPGILS